MVGDEVMAKTSGWRENVLEFESPFEKFGLDLFRCVHCQRCVSISQVCIMGGK